MTNATGHTFRPFSEPTALAAGSVKYCVLLLAATVDGSFSFDFELTEPRLEHTNTDPRL